MSGELKLERHSRSYIRKSITGIHNKISDFHTYTSVEQQTLKTKLNNYKTRLLDSDAQIRSLMWATDPNESDLEEELIRCDEYQDKITECLVYLDSKSFPVTSEAIRSHLKSPVAPLPKFESKEGEDLTKFLLHFETALAKFNYSDYDKLQLLKQQVSGRALKLLNHLEADKQGYQDARAVLVQALASTEIQKFNTIKRLSEMKLTEKDDPFDYICNIKAINENVKKLSIKTDDFLQYYYWMGLNESFRSQLVQLTNNIRPSLQEIDDRFFEACERYSLERKNCKEKRKESIENTSTAALAVNVHQKQDSTPSFKPCSICSAIEKKDANHPIFRCNKFTSVQEKISQLKKLNACLKCSHTNHNTNQCRFRFNSKCRNCSEWHFSFLCQKNCSSPISATPKGNSKASKSDTVTASNLGIINGCFLSEFENSIILPTFSCFIEDKISVRALKDGGCQSNLISNDLVEKLNLKVIKENLNLTVSGINTTQVYKSKLVEFGVCFGDEFRTISALTLPSVDLNLNLPKLEKVVNAFIDKGFTLCDKFLLEGGNVLNNIGLILGSCSSYCVPETEVFFGKDSRSTYSQTPFGIMLKGDIKEILKDMPCLSNCDTRVCSALVEESKKCSVVEISLNENLNMNDSKMLDSNTFQHLQEHKFSSNDTTEEMNETDLDKITSQALNEHCNFYVNYDTKIYDENSSELNSEIVEYTLSHTKQDEEGRLVMPLLWNSRVAHLLGQNYNLSRNILMSVFKKLKGQPDRLKLMNDAIVEQERLGIVERIENLDQFIRDHPESSFLPHMGIFKLDRETTKCRIVFLSNLAEKDPNKPITYSHNQCINSGPSLNQKLSTSLLHLRFDSHLLCFDIQKAFNNISLNEVDSNRLLFLWFRNPEKEDYSIVGYRNVRLSFGLRCSPTILLLGMYKMLILDAKEDSFELQKIKSLIYQLSYMDNCAISTNDSKELVDAHDKLNSIFNPYHFFLQQFITNDLQLQKEIDQSLMLKENTPVKVKLLGMLWDRVKDSLSTRPIKLKLEACTKRQILSSIASQFDLYNINGPVLNRSRLFLHSLQCDKSLGWDEKIDDVRTRDWKNIVRQANATPVIEIKRFIGRRDDSYNLIAFSDSSEMMYGTSIYIQNLRSQEVNFLMSKNRIINKSMEEKGIPSLEMRGITLAAECLIDLYKEITGTDCVHPIKILKLNLFTDSLVCLSWLNSYSHRMDKMQKRSVFVMNRIAEIDRLCEVHPITFSHVTGIQNPADCVTRCLSFKRLVKTNYLDAQLLIKELMKTECDPQNLKVTIPNPLTEKNIEFQKPNFVGFSLVISNTNVFSDYERVKTNCSTFSRVVGTYEMVFTFIHKIKSKLADKYAKVLLENSKEDSNFYNKALMHVLRMEQETSFPNVCNYFKKKSLNIKEIPNMVTQLNLFKDSLGIIRVQHKLGKFKKDERFVFPILISKNSRLTNLIIDEYHKKLNHAGCYTVLSEIRKTFWIPNHFITIKKVLKSCIHCRRLNQRTVKLNQSDYREFRVDPPKIPFAYCYIDFWGPSVVKINEQKAKVWILCITCMWTRGINLKVCIDQSLNEFLRALQLHGFEYGIPQFCISDLGSQLVAGSNVINDFLKDPETQNYFLKSGIKQIKFDQYFKGCSKLGGMVESCVKLTKRLMFGSVGKNILELRDFEYFICQTVHIVNRRPIAFVDALRDSSGENFPEPITPECLIRGYNLASYNLVPNMQKLDTSDPTWQIHPIQTVKDQFAKLRKVKDNLIELYHEEFMSNLILQAVNRKERYKPINHKSLSVGDLVLLKEVYCKPFNYPMGKIKEVFVNCNNEVTGVIVMKGDTKELVKRHSSTIIPLLSAEEFNIESNDHIKVDNKSKVNSKGENKNRRKAALLSEERNKMLFASEEAS